MLDDHTNLQGSSPLKGLNRFIYCGIFPDMNAPYDMKLNSKLMQKAQELQIHLKEGKYASVFGPQLDTRVQYRFLGIIGADLLGINTTTEVTVANQLKLPCAAISVITDECDPDHLKPVDGADIIETAGKVDQKRSKFFFTLINLYTLKSPEYFSLLQ